MCFGWDTFGIYFDYFNSPFFAISFFLLSPSVFICGYQQFRLDLTPPKFKSRVMRRRFIRHSSVVHPFSPLPNNLTGVCRLQGETRLHS
jgi:hypothetical protein